METPRQQQRTTTLSASSTQGEDARQPTPADVFATTRWTLVLSAASGSSPQSERALAELCQAYWYPLYAFVRRRGHSHEEAEDLTQTFFASFLTGNQLGQLSAERGKFRAYLLACLKHFLANEWARAATQKRGGGIEHLSLDWRDAEDRYGLEPPDLVTPDLLYDRAWALALLERVMGLLKQECRKEGKLRLFECANLFLSARGDAIPYAEAAAQLSMDEGAARVAVHRLRKRYRTLLREEIAQTLGDPSAVDEELRSLKAALSLPG